MARTKRTLFTFLGWLVWKLLALVGVPAAKRRVGERRSQRSGGVFRRSRRRH